jgi:hypothetical protein
MGSAEKTCRILLFSSLCSVDIEYQRDPNLNWNNIRVHSHNRITNPPPLSLLPPSVVPFPFSVAPVVLALLKIYFEHSLCVLFLLLRIWARALGTLTLQCIENPIYVFPEMNLCCLVPSSYIPVSVSDLYIPRIGLPICPQQNRQTDPVKM